MGLVKNQLIEGGHFDEVSEDEAYENTLGIKKVPMPDKHISPEFLKDSNSFYKWLLGE